MNKSSRAALPFLGVGLAFLAIGIGGQKTFLILGLVFLVLAFVFYRQRKRRE
jgi:LPXTG-motif cell wall-anchored protein